jgi:hypothetical protein
MMAAPRKPTIERGARPRSRRRERRWTLGWHVGDAATRDLLERYIARLALPVDRLRVTTARKVCETWLGRRVRSSIGGAYAYVAARDEHLILINLPRIDLSQPKALEVVVAEELVHMRDRLDGDLRRHAKHGHDRIARRVSDLTGASLAEIRGALIPPVRRPARYVYVCPRCRTEIPRRSKGTWSCGRCAPRFDTRYILQFAEAR